MDIYYAHTLPVVNNPKNLKARTFFSFDHAEVMHLTLSPGESTDLHSTPVDVLFYIVQGEGECIIGKELAPLHQGALVFSHRDTPHLLRNPDGTENFVILVFKLPRPMKNER